MSANLISTLFSLPHHSDDSDCSAERAVRGLASRGALTMSTGFPRVVVDAEVVGDGAVLRVPPAVDGLPIALDDVTNSTLRRSQQTAPRTKVGHGRLFAWRSQIQSVVTPS